MHDGIGENRQSHSGDFFILFPNILLLVEKIPARKSCV